MSVYDAEVYRTDDWRLLTKYRVTRGGGGVFLAVCSPILIERMQPYQTAHCEEFWARFTVIYGHVV